MLINKKIGVNYKQSFKPQHGYQQSFSKLRMNGVFFLFQNQPQRGVT